MMVYYTYEVLVSTQYSFLTIYFVCFIMMSTHYQSPQVIAKNSPNMYLASAKSS